MAELFKSNFGDMLVSEPLPNCREPDRVYYPSPNQLKRRIIIKHKKLENGSSEVLVNTHKQDDDLSSMYNGFLYIEDKLDGQWTRVRYACLCRKVYFGGCLNRSVCVV